MIDESDKQEAWMALCESIARGQVRWPNHLSQEQIDYVVACLHKSAFPGMQGRESRSIARWNKLDFAFEILRAREPDKSDRRICEAVAKHYGCGWSTVRKARAKMREQEFSFARRHKELGLGAEDFAALSLPHISPKDFAGR